MIRVQFKLENGIHTVYIVLPMCVSVGNNVTFIKRKHQGLWGSQGLFVQGNGCENLLRNKIYPFLNSTKNNCIIQVQHDTQTKQPKTLLKIFEVFKKNIFLYDKLL